MRRLLTVVLALVVLLVGADRVGDYLAEKAAAQTLKNSEHLPTTPSVDIAGFPFLTQLAAGDFDQITVHASEVPVGRVSVLRLSDFTVVLRGLTVSRSFHRFHARSAQATARASYADLSRALKIPITYAGGGRVRAHASVTIAGRTLGGSITARPQLHDAALTFGSFSGEGQIAEQATRALARILGVAIPLAELPFRVHVQQLAATPNGLVLQLRGNDLSYSR